MFKYFKELLEVLRQIESHLSKIAGCVQTNRRQGDHSTLSTKHWNDR